MADINQIEDLKHNFLSTPGIGDKLPNPKDVADKSSFYLKSGTDYIKHKMVNGVWMKELVDSDSQVILRKV